jgi:cysteine desulfurase
MGIGALLLKREHKPVPVLHGGGQEREIRSGTLATSLIVGLGVALEEAALQQPHHHEHVQTIRDVLISRIESEVPGSVLRGDRHQRLPGNAHFTFDGCEGDALLMLLDAAGIHVSTGSACTAGIPQPSHVLLGMGVAVTEAVGALRFSLGASSTIRDVDALMEVLPEVVLRAQRAGKTLKSQS